MPIAHDFTLKIEALLWRRQAPPHSIERLLWSSFPIPGRPREGLESAPSCRRARKPDMPAVAPEETLPAQSGNGAVGWKCVFPDLPGLRCLSLNSVHLEAATPDTAPISAHPRGKRRNGGG